MEGCFKKATRSHPFGEYCLLIVNGYASHISIEFIKYTLANKIIYLCLLSHLTYLLQLMNVGVFGTLSKTTKSFYPKKLFLQTTKLIKLILFC